jgi:hypothetical protein
MLSAVKQAGTRPDSAWRKSRLAARLLLRKEAGRMRPRDQILARRLIRVERLQRLLGTGTKTRQICSCRQFCVQAHTARSSMPETAMSRLMCISNGTEARQNIGSNLLCWRPAGVSAEVN